jgi:hypothetical protein
MGQPFAQVDDVTFWHRHPERLDGTLMPGLGRFGSDESKTRPDHCRHKTRPKHIPAIELVWQLITRARNCFQIHILSLAVRGTCLGAANVGGLHAKTNAGTLTTQLPKVKWLG